MLNFRQLAFQTFESQFEERICPDQSVGVINTLRGQDDFGYCEINELPENSQRLIMILESPHTNEYEDFPKPAKGNTGKFIRRHILGVAGLSGYQDRHLILMNAIPYQCSLGFPTYKCRDSVFTTVWNNGGKDAFAVRLRELVREGDVVVNCCTKGETQITLRQMVQEAIDSVVQERSIQVLKRTHPSSWNIESNRLYVWD